MSAMKKRKLIAGSEAVKVKRQHVSPCSDCPFARTALPGWLAGESIAWWLVVAHGEGRMECHTRKLASGAVCHCAGAAIFRSNICKGDVFRLPADREKVFAWDNEFAEHHAGRKFTAADILAMKIEERERIIAAAPKIKKGYTLCEDCGAQYKIGVPHMMFCKARTCERCQTSSEQVIEPNEDGDRICFECESRGVEPSEEALRAEDEALR